MKDPLMQWDGPFPYDVFEKAGVTPESSMPQVNDASFDLIGRGMTPEERAAFNELRLVKKRLVVDFFLYRNDASELIASAQNENEE